MILIRFSKKLKDIRASSKKAIVVVKEGMDMDLLVLHDGHLKNALGISWTDNIVINHMDT